MDFKKDQVNQEGSKKSSKEEAVSTFRIPISPSVLGTPSEEAKPMFQVQAAIDRERDRLKDQGLDDDQIEIQLAPLKKRLQELVDLRKNDPQGYKKYLDEIEQRKREAVNKLLDQGNSLKQIKKELDDIY